MAARISKDFDGISVAFRELTLDEIRDWLAEIEAKAGATADDSVRVNIDSTYLLVFDGQQIDDILFLTDLTADRLGGLRPSSIDAIHEQAKALNARFFAMRDRLIAMGAAVLEKSG